ncbi:DUF4225 domain-containing protein [Pseudomonas sp. B21-051]|uniref:DUF4225 domain-containing protein n=1 Tax=Pseudomonas sp. B21-051 TaxID=2895491 RepID=UPI00215E8C74|nr:DUF4225 domain-containing protein [Pseudomonas sp. B21-051]UVK86479.1 DUF4225 domain-containing protein [Pseudomonas sp. B21-051]
MNEDSCDINDVTRAASDLVAFGCQIGTIQLYDSFNQLRFGEIVSSYANEVIRAVDAGFISARQGLQELREEHSGLLNKVSFYAQNGVGVAAGMMQIQIASVHFASRTPKNAVAGTAYSLHGANNIYEGLANIYYGPENPAVVGPTRKLYQFLASDSSRGNIAYYGVDIGLSTLSILQPVRKPDSVELFIRDPMNYERAYKRMGKISLAFETLIDGITIRNLDNEVAQQTNNKNHRSPLNSSPDIKYP